MTKADLRKIYKDKRSQLTPREIEKYNDLILINFQKIHLPFLSCLHTYMASDRLSEVDTSTIVRYLKFKNPELMVLVPKIDMTLGNMHHLHFHDETEMIENIFGIAEPADGNSFNPVEIDLVLVPLLVFDKRGSRVGYGKGYYDKFLSECRADVIKIGLSFFEPLERIDDISTYDIPLNYCVTPKLVFEFQKDD